MVVSLTAQNDEKFPRMTSKTLRGICKQQKLYLTPYLNDVLYLHYKGFAKIENLEEYTGLKCLWLECNGISTIENLGHLKELRCLYLHQNLISKIENLDELCELDTLNLSNNSIARIENISCLKKLNTLQVSHNRLSSKDDIAHLVNCDNLSVVDLSQNWLNDPRIVDVLSQMKNLRVVNLMGNDVIKEIKNYRKTLILKCKNLKYLDDRPVFPRERACAEAWERGGRDAENEERQNWINIERKRIQDSVNYLQKIRQNAAQRLEENKQQNIDFENEVYLFVKILMFFHVGAICGCLSCIFIDFRFYLDFFSFEVLAI